MFSTRRGLPFLFGLALALRVAAIVYLFDADHLPFTYEHGEIAENLLAGRGFAVRFLGADGPTSQQAPFYPALLSTSYWLFGPGTSAALVAMQVLQAIAGAALTVCVAWLTWTLIPRPPALGWIAGLICALHPAQIYMATHMQVAVWSTLALVLTVGLAARQRLLLSALSAGGMLLIEPIFVIALPVIAWLVAQSSMENCELRQRLRRVAAFGACVALLLCPWLIRNYQAHGEPVFIKSTFGYAFWQGNNAHSWGTDKIPKPESVLLRATHDGTLRDRGRALWEARHETIYIDDALLSDADYDLLGHLSEPARSRLLFERALQDLRSEPSRYPALCLQRLRYFLFVDETNPKAAHPVYRASTAIWLILSLAGLVLLRHDFRSLWPMLVIFLLVAAFHMLTITSARFRIPVETLIYLYMAAPVAVALRYAAALLRRFGAVASGPRPALRGVAIRQQLDERHLAPRRT